MQTIITDKGKSTVSVVLTYFNSVAYMNYTSNKASVHFLKVGKVISISKAQESPFCTSIIINVSLPIQHTPIRYR